MSTTSQRILIVDDMRLFSSALASELERKGHAVVVAGDGPEALANLRSADVIVFDLDMRTLDCLRLLEALNLDGRLPRATMLAVTDGSDAGVACRLHALGVQRVLTRRQFTVGQLAAVISGAARSLAA